MSGSPGISVQVSEKQEPLVRSSRPVGPRDKPGVTVGEGYFANAGNAALNAATFGLSHATIYGWLGFRSKKCW